MKETNQKIINNTSQEEGSALVLIMVLLVVASMVAATILQQNRRDTFWNPKVETQRKMERAIAALEAYQRTYKQLPCVAPRDAAQGDSDHGEALPNCTPMDPYDTSTERVDIGGGVYVRIGALPYRTLLLQEDAGEDAWGNKLLYAVSERLIDPSLYMTSTGGIHVDKPSGSVTSTAAFVILSHGADGKGAYRNVSGSRPKACTDAPGTDQENCNDNGFFWIDALQDDEGASHYEDQVEWKPVDYTAQSSP